MTGQRACSIFMCAVKVEAQRIVFIANKKNCLHPLETCKNENHSPIKMCKKQAYEPGTKTRQGDIFSMTSESSTAHAKRAAIAPSH